jgi:DNA-binding GntR family transcriptional regulator
LAVLERLPTRDSTAREVYQRLRSAIVSGALTPELRLYEQRIAADLGVSRTPVREALAMLEAEDLVVSMRNRGTIVRRISADEVQETYEVRAVLEGHAARLAAGQIDAEQLAALRRLDEQMNCLMRAPRSVEDEQVRALGELNAEFHRTIAVATGNRVLARTMDWLLTTPLYARAYYAYSDPLKRASISDHGRMIELLKARDADACERFWREHLYRGRDYMIEHLKTREVGE